MEFSMDNLYNELVNLAGIQKADPEEAERIAQELTESIAAREAGPEEVEALAKERIKAPSKDLTGAEAGLAKDAYNSSIAREKEAINSAKQEGKNIMQQMFEGASSNLIGAPSNSSTRGGKGGGGRFKSKAERPVDLLKDKEMIERLFRDLQGGGVNRTERAMK